MTSKTEQFEESRDRLRGLAYRLTGSVADTDDILQDAFLRWQRTTQEVSSPDAYLSKLVTRLCLDSMTSARARRESYVGPWLPEPVTEGALGQQPETLASDVTFALMLALERLTPLERAAFILHDVFDVDYGQLAETLGRNEATCRQLAARARANVRRERPRSTLTEAEQQQVVGAFFAAVTSGDTEAIGRVLTEQAVFYGDGGGQVKSALKPITGRDKVGRFFIGIVKKFPLRGEVRFEPTRVNGGLGYLVWIDGRLDKALGFDFDGGQIATVYAVSNPDKLAHLQGALRTGA